MDEARLVSIKIARLPELLGKADRDNEPLPSDERRGRIDWNEKLNACIAPHTGWQ
jgi:hypothetical protein